MKWTHTGEKKQDLLVPRVIQRSLYLWLLQRVFTIRTRNVNCRIFDPLAGTSGICECWLDRLIDRIRL